MFTIGAGTGPATGATAGFGDVDIASIGITEVPHGVVGGGTLPLWLPNQLC